jgi:hypothetical protein
VVLNLTAHDLHRNGVHAEGGDALQLLHVPLPGTALPPLLMRVCGWR